MTISTYDRLIDSAVVLFAKKGFYGTSIRDIAEQLGIRNHEFDKCIKEKRYQSKISSDVAFGKQIGLGNVPVVFIRNSRACTRAT